MSVKRLNFNRLYIILSVLVTFSTTSVTAQNIELTPTDTIYIVDTVYIQTPPSVGYEKKNEQNEITMGKTNPQI